MVLIGWPVGRSLPVRAPPGETKSRIIREAFPGTPATAAWSRSSSGVHLPSVTETGKVVLTNLLVFVLNDRMVAVECSSLGWLHIPSSRAKTPIMLDRLPQFPE